MQTHRGQHRDSNTQRVEQPICCCRNMDALLPWVNLLQGVSHMAELH